ncbi:MAG: FAD:protein FMN transferase [Tissierellia bacterium]|nr:FAD:protein FMN transferase [Tissierellia bacterium]
MVRKFVSIIIVIAILFNFTACKEKELVRYESEFIMLFDTVTRIVGFAHSKEEFTEYSQIIYDNLREYHQLYDIYNEYEGINNLKTINDNAGIKAVQVDERVIDLLKFSIDMYEKTNGETNIAFGSVLKVWHNYRTEGVEDPENAKLPPKEELIEASKHTNIEDIIIDEEESTVFLRDPLMSLDVGAVAKGYATEQVSKIVRDKGLTSGLLSVGGNVRGINGNVVTGDPWNVGVQDPVSLRGQSILKLVKIDDVSMVTSGDYERYYIVDDEKYNHIIDVDTLYPSNFFSAVTIICEDSGMADALSTATFTMPFEEGLELINSMPDTEAMWIFSDGSIRYSDNFEIFIK